MQLQNGDADGMDATMTLKPGQIAQVLADPEFVRQITGHRGSRAPEAGHIHLTPDTDPENTFRTRQRSQRPRVRFEELFAPEESTDVNAAVDSQKADENQGQGQNQV